MRTREIESLFLNIGDVMEISLKNFYYRISMEGEQKMIEVEQNKRNQKEWIPCPTITGSYCGCRYQDGGNLNIIKVRASKPFKMNNFYHNYLTFAPSQITDISVIEKAKGTVLDQVCHAVVRKKTAGKGNQITPFGFPEEFFGMGMLDSGSTLLKQGIMPEGPACGITQCFLLLDPLGSLCLPS